MKNNKTIWCLIIFISILIMVYISYIYHYCNKYNDFIYPGVKIGNISVGGKNKEEALNLINEVYKDNLIKKKIVIKIPGKDYWIKYSDIDAKYDIEKTVDNAFEFGKDRNLFKKYILIRKAVRTKLEVELSFNTEKINKIVDKIEKEINKKAVNASIRKNGSSKFSITPEKLGQELDKYELIREITNIVNCKLENTILVYAKIDKVQAEIKEYDLKQIDTKISTYTTNFSKSSNGRAANIELAVKAIDGMVLMPGDIFSFNKIVGDRTVQKGYQPAPAIINGKFVPSIGGGVCQVSTTLYNAVLRGNMFSIERANHSIPSNYVAIGMDAAVAYEGIDYKFRNTLPYPIYIEGYIKNRNLIFNIYSNLGLLNRWYDIVNEVYEVIPPNLEYIDDPYLLEGKNIIVKKGKSGYKVRVYKITYEKGKKISKELVSEDYYNPISMVIRRGTKRY